MKREYFLWGQLLNHSDAIDKAALRNKCYFSVLIHDVLIYAGLVLPLVAAGVVVLLLLVTAVLLLRRRKSVEGEGGGSSIVVYPTHQSGGPQFL
jgi:hypothetical protein